MNVKKIITLLLALVLAAGMVACGTKPAEDTDGKDGSEEAKALYEQLMAQENAILSENTALWEKVFMAADKGMAMIEDGGNYGDFLLKTIENAKDQFTEEELTLLTGEATRDPIELGAPSRGGLSVATNGTPILGVGQFNSRLANKTVKNGYHILNLVTNEKQRLIAGDGKDKNSNYSGFLGAALFDSATGTMIVGGQNGVLYTAEFGPVKDTYNYQANEITLSETIQGYKTQVKGQDRTDTNINASVAVYNNYVYYGDIGGILQCVDLNTLTPVWAVDTGDSIESTPALDVEDGSVVALYTANAIVNGGKNGVCTIRRINALTGAEEWAYEVPDLVYASKRDIGVYASPVVGQGAIRDLVIFTATNDEAGAKVIALSKADGKVVWQTALESATLSSPVAVYNEDGDAWLIQAESNGKIHLMDATDGSILDTLTLTGGEGEESTLAIEGSPAVYGNLMIIGTTGKDAGGVYCIKIE